IVSLILASVFFMVYSGNLALSADGIAFSVLGAFENTVVGTSLVYGGLVGLGFSLLTVLKQKQT
ncbi:Na+/H+ antiporter NhaC family protein, partial [Psychromonas aquatilis]